MNNQTTISERLYAMGKTLQQTQEISTVLLEVVENADGLTLEDILSLELIAVKFSDILTDQDVLLALRVLVDTNQIDEPNLKNITVPE
jgi:hypothetical protein